jgi:hypothetical protein
MAESGADRSAILGAIQTALAGVTTPVLSVVQGPAWSIDQDAQCNFWYAGDQADDLFGAHALAERQIVEKFGIQVFWKPPALPEQAGPLAQVAWDACRSIEQALLAHTTLGIGAGVAMAEFEPARAGLWQHYSGLTFYALELELHLHVPSGDTEGNP